MIGRIAPAFGAVVTAVLFAAVPAQAQEVGKYCAIYKDGKAQTSAVISSTSRTGCKDRAVRAGADGYGLACQVPGGDVIVTARIPNEGDQAPDFASWNTSDEAIRTACSRMWGAR